MAASPSNSTIDWAQIRESGTVFEDESLLALNKPAGFTLVGERNGPDIVRAAESAGEKLYPVNRIDKVTSGLVVLAKSLAAHGPLTRQFADRTVQKTYLAVVRGTGLPDTGVIDLPLMTAKSGRVRVGGERERITHDGTTWSLAAGDVFDHTKVYPSVSLFSTAWRGDGRAVLVVRPITGRRHQIRVHLAWIGFAIDGDPLFDRAAAAPGPRTGLHSWWLAIDAGRPSRRRLTLEAPPGPDLWAPAAGTPEELYRAARDRLPVLAELQGGLADADRYAGGPADE